MAISKNNKTPIDKVCIASKFVVRDAAIVAQLSQIYQRVWGSVMILLTPVNNSHIDIT
jgi:hypothetical protein